MFPIVLISAVALILLVAWIVGEAKDIRALRISGAIAPLLIVPLAFKVGEVVGHGRAYVAAREATDDFLVAAGAAVERGDSAESLKAFHRLHESSSDSEKPAGSFFFYDMADAKSRLNANATRPFSVPAVFPETKNESR